MNRGSGSGVSGVSGPPAAPLFPRRGPAGRRVCGLRCSCSRLLSPATSGRAGALAPLCALLFALCLNCRRALKILNPPRQCRAGRSELRPGAGRRMTSSGSWPQLRKYENGKRKEKKNRRKKRASLSNTRKARSLGEERDGDGVREEIERRKKRTVFLDGIHGRCTCGSGAPGRTSAVQQPAERSKPNM